MKPEKMNLDRWKKAVYEPFIHKHKERKARFGTSSGVVLDPLYSEKNPPKSIGLPGCYPFTRGILPSVYRGKLWSIRQYAGFGTASESNARYRYLLSQGQTGLSVAFDLPTQLGMDSDDEQSRGEVGKVGVAVDSIDDMERLFMDIPLDRVSVSMTINAPAAVLWSMYIVLAEKRGITPDKLNGTIQNDVLKEYIARGTYIFPPKPSLRLVTDIFEYGSQHVPNWNTISISGYHIREAGATAVEELGFTFANAICYVESAIERGLNPDSFLPRISFFWNAHNHFFEETAKFRAARRIWATLCRTRFRSVQPRSWMHRFHVQTGGSTLTAQQPLNNIVRTTIQALSSVLGGTQSLHTNAYDEALCLPTETAATVALRTQQILAYESKVADTVDPLGGSYFIEKMTDEIERHVCKIIEKIDDMGGMITAIEKGYPQHSIQESSYAYQRAVESQEEVVVGVNEFKTDNEVALPVLKVNERCERDQIRNLRKFRQKRNSRNARTACRRLTVAAQSGKNLMPFILEAVRQNATVGEITVAMKDIFGEAKHESNL